MIYFNFTIQNLWHNEVKRPWRDLFQGEWSLTKNKTLELRFDFYTYDWFEFGLNTRWRGEDHAGPRLELRLLGLGMFIGIRDRRHWNRYVNRWVNYDNENEVKEWW